MYVCFRNFKVDILKVDFRGRKNGMEFWEEHYSRLKVSRMYRLNDLTSLWEKLLLQRRNFPLGPFNSGQSGQRRVKEKLGPIEITFHFIGWANYHSFHTRGMILFEILFASLLTVEFSSFFVLPVSLRRFWKRFFRLFVVFVLSFENILWEYSCAR